VLLMCALACAWPRWSCWMGALSGALYRGGSGCTRRVIVTTSSHRVLSLPELPVTTPLPPPRPNASLSTLRELLFEKIARVGPMYLQGGSSPFGAPGGNVTGA
jgi:hypothetical protein